MALYPQNLHTHGTFGDGRNEYEETIQQAIKLGLTSIGFSEHGYTYFDDSCCMTKEESVLYRNRINELKEKYAGKIDVFLGIEFDVYSEDDLFAYDYVIGDAHYIKKDDDFLIVDHGDYNELLGYIEKYYNGNPLGYAKDYFETQTLVTKLKKCDIVGHFDLITKMLEKHPIIDTESQIYKNYALEAVTAVAEKIKVFEINVGAISRGYRSTPYPAPFILKRIKELGCGVVISSDCHNFNYLTKNFDTGISLAKSCGFEEVLVLTKDGFKGLKI